MAGEKTVNEQLKQLAEKLAAHPQYSENPQVRAIVDEYRVRLLDPALSSVEVPDVMKAIKGSLADYNKTGEDAIESVLPGLRLREQYESQRSVALRSGLFDASLKEVPMGLIAPINLPVIRRMEQMYPMPGWKEVREALIKNKEIIKEKSAQGFTQMLIVPFGYDLKTMAEKFKEKVRELGQGPGIFGASGEKVDFNKDNNDYPVYIREGWDESHLVYYPKKYDQQDHGGLFKEDAIKINGAWQLCFLEDMPVIPLATADNEVIGGRRKIDRKGSCIKGQTGSPSIQQFKEAMDKLGNKYRYERGQTPEQYLWMQLTSLLAKEKPVIMDYENNEWIGTYLTECFNVSSLVVPVAYWDVADRQLYLGRFVPEDRFDFCGVRPAVNIIK